MNQNTLTTVPLTHEEVAAGMEVLRDFPCHQTLDPLTDHSSVLSHFLCLSHFPHLPLIKSLPETMNGFDGTGDQLLALSTDIRRSL